LGAELLYFVEGVYGVGEGGVRVDDAKLFLKLLLTLSLDLFQLQNQTLLVLLVFEDFLRILPGICHHKHNKEEFNQKYHLK